MCARAPPPALLAWPLSSKVSGVRWGTPGGCGATVLQRHARRVSGGARQGPLSSNVCAPAPPGARRAVGRAPPRACTQLPPSPVCTPTQTPMHEGRHLVGRARAPPLSPWSGTSLSVCVCRTMRRRLVRGSPAPRAPRATRGPRRVPGLRFRGSAAARKRPAWRHGGVHGECSAWPLACIHGMSALQAWMRSRGEHTTPSRQHRLHAAPGPPSPARRTQRSTRRGASRSDVAVWGLSRLVERGYRVWLGGVIAFG